MTARIPAEEVSLANCTAQIKTLDQQIEALRRRGTAGLNEVVEQAAARAGHPDLEGEEETDEQPGT